MRVSDEGIAALVAHEGIVPGPYRDSVGVWTVFIGHTASAGPPEPAKMARGMPADLDAALRDAFSVFRDDLATFEARVNKHVKVPLAQHEFDALVSFDFNTGGIYYRNKQGQWVNADLVMHMNRGDRKAAASGFMNWTKPASITERRRAEQRLFQVGAYPTGRANVWRVSESGGVIWRPVRTLSQEQILSYLRPGGQPRPEPKPIPRPVPKPPEPANRTGPPALTIAGLLFGAAVALFAIIKWG